MFWSMDWDFQPKARPWEISSSCMIIVRTKAWGELNKHTVSKKYERTLALTSMSGNRIWRNVWRNNFCKKYRTKNKKGIQTAMKPCVIKSSTNWEISYEVVMVEDFVTLLRHKEFIKLKCKEWSMQFVSSGNLQHNLDAHCKHAPCSERLTDSRPPQCL